MRCNPWGHKESDTTEQLPFHFLLSCIGEGNGTPLQYSGHLLRITDSFEKTLMLGKIEGRRKRGRQDEMVRWHHQLNGREFEQAPGVGDGQEGLVCCSP